MRKTFFNQLGFVLPGIVLLALVSGCGRETHSHDQSVDAPVIQAIQPDGPIKIVTTTGMITDIVRRVAGRRAEVTGLMGPGVDPHLYKAKQSDISALNQADIVFYNGLHLEGKMGELLDRLGRRKPTVQVTRAVPRERLLLLSEDSSQYDPHLWFDVELWMSAVEVVRDSMMQLTPDYRDEYEANAAELLEELAELHEYCRERIGSIPERQRVLITAHDAFGYFGRAYDIEVRGIQGISTESEASVRDINELIDFIVERGVKAVFVETSVSQKNIEALIEGARARGHSLKIGGELFSDAMGAAGTPEGTYPGMIRHNVDTIADNLK